MQNSWQMFYLHLQNFTSLKANTILPRKSSLSFLIIKCFEKLVMKHIKPCCPLHWTQSSLLSCQAAQQMMPLPPPSPGPHQPRSRGYICPNAVYRLSFSIQHIIPQHLIRKHPSLQRNISWTLNTSSISKKTRQHLYFRQRLRKACHPPPILTTFYRGTIESNLSITTWYGKHPYWIARHSGIAQPSGKIKNIFYSP